MHLLSIFLSRINTSEMGGLAWEFIFVPALLVFLYGENYLMRDPKICSNEGLLEVVL